MNYEIIVDGDTYYLSYIKSCFYNGRRARDYEVLRRLDENSVTRHRSLLVFEYDIKKKKIRNALREALERRYTTIHDLDD